jgi:hypothetical protein
MDTTEKTDTLYFRPPAASACRDKIDTRDKTDTNDTLYFELARFSAEMLRISFFRAQFQPAFDFCPRAQAFKAAEFFWPRPKSSGRIPRQIRLTIRWSIRPRRAVAKPGTPRGRR